MVESNPDRSRAPSQPEDGRRLDSWKEIAAYLNRDVTTVRRWEKREGLPVHRHRHAALGSVYAFTREIDSWQLGREHPVYRDEQPPPHVSRPRLVGRDDELHRLHEHLARALEGKRATVFIAGELGIGKTALTQTFLDQVRADVWGAAGQCVEQYGKGEPYLPILDGLERIIRDVRYPDAVRVVEEYAPSWLDQLSLRSRIRTRRHRDRPVGTSAGQMAGELTDAIEALAAVKPLVLLLEDLHWSDQPTLEFVARLARRPDRARLLVIGTYRPAELVESGSPLLRVGRELRVHFQADEIELSPLSRDAVGELIARDRTWNDVRRTAASLRQWSGNPLFLIHFLEHLERTGRIIERDGEWHLDLDRQGRIVPNSLRMLVEEQVDRLGPEHRRLLEIASVVGETFPATLVAHAAPLDVTLVEGSFEDLCRRSHLVTHREVGRLPDGTASAGYAFVHEFYRQVIYERVPKATLTELHRRIGTELERVYGAHATEISSELALHFDRGQDFRRAVRHYSIAAENALARNADREAQIVLSKASELVVRLSPGDDRDRMELLLRAHFGAVLGRVTQNASWMSPDSDEEIETLPGDVGDPELVDAMIRLSRFHSVSGDLVAAKEIADRAAETGHVRGRALFEAPLWLAEGFKMTARIEEALAAAEEGLSIVRRTGARCCDAELYRVRGEAMIARRRPPAPAHLNRYRDAAEASFWAGITVARQQDARTLELRTTLSLCRLLRDTGRQDEAIRALAPVCELFASADDTPDLAEARRLLNGAVS